MENTFSRNNIIWFAFYSKLVAFTHFEKIQLRKDTTFFSKNKTSYIFEKKNFSVSVACCGKLTIIWWLKIFSFRIGHSVRHFQLASELKKTSTVLSRWFFLSCYKNSGRVNICIFRLNIFSLTLKSSSSERNENYFKSASPFSHKEVPTVHVLTHPLFAEAQEKMGFETKGCGFWSQDKHIVCNLAICNTYYMKYTVELFRAVTPNVPNAGNSQSRKRKFRKANTESFRGTPYLYHSIKRIKNYLVIPRLFTTFADKLFRGSKWTPNSIVRRSLVSKRLKIHCLK